MSPLLGCRNSTISNVNAEIRETATLTVHLHVHHVAALVSRQFMDMSRIRIEGLLAAFPKLVGSGKQHTYVETENVRYVYQPMENLFLLLVTNKQSNILEDLETLRLISKLVCAFMSVGI
jgi:hypothetical protein